MRRTWNMRVVAAFSVLSLAAASCGGSDDAAPAGAGVAVQLLEWGVHASPAAVAAGAVTFTVKNAGMHEHNMKVFKTDLAPEKLPVANGMADENAAGVEAIGAVQALSSKQTRSLTVTLAAGAYVLVCNLPGHYGSGMRSALQVTERPE